MMFDKLCNIIEKQFPKFKSVLEATHLFVFPYVPHDVLDKEISGDLEWVKDNFFLPFPKIAIEDKASCIVLYDTEKNQTGLSGTRLFIEYMPVVEDQNIDAFKDSNTIRERINSDPRMLELHNQGYALITFGSINNIKLLNTKKFYSNSTLFRSAMVSKTDIKFDNLQNTPDPNIKGPAINAIQAIQEVMYFNQPNKFILKETPKKLAKGNSPVIPRSHQRPIYTLLKPGEIRTRMNLPKVTIGKKSPEPHERRRTHRFLSDKRYSKDLDGNPIEPKIIPFGDRKGEPYYKHVIVPPVWVGPRKSYYKNKHYEVLINK